MTGLAPLAELPSHPWSALVGDPADLLAVRGSVEIAGAPASDRHPTVVAIGLLDRVSAEIPVDLQQRDLARAVFEQVEPGGVAWFSVQNRLSVLHIVGIRPRHGRPFEPLLPRRAASLLYRLAPSESQMRSATLTRSGYHDLLATAGFGDIEFLVAFFDAGDPDFVATRRGGASLRRYLRTVRYSRSRRGRIAVGVLGFLDLVRAVDQLAPGFIIKARRPRS